MFYVMLCLGEPFAFPPPSPQATRHQTTESGWRMLHPNRLSTQALFWGQGAKLACRATRAPRSVT